MKHSTALMQLIPVGLMIVPLFIGNGVLSLWRQWETHKNRRFPFAYKLARSPGHSLLAQMDDKVSDVASYLAGLAAMPVTLYAVYLQTALSGEPIRSGYALILLLSAVGMMGYMCVGLLRRAKEIRTLRLGYAGEVAVGQALNELLREGYYVFHDFPANGFNIDHVVVGCAGVFAVETKVRSKPVSGNGMRDATVVYDGQALYFSDRPQRPHTDFQRQAREQADWLRRWLAQAAGEEIPVYPVLTLPGWYVERTGKPSLGIVNPKEFRGFFKRCPGSPLDNGQIKRVVYQLEQKCRDVDLRPDDERNKATRFRR